MKMSDFNHLLLYAKGWYEQSDNVLVDVKKILGHRCNIDPAYMSNRDVWEMCVEAFLMYCHSDSNIKNLLLELFKPRPEEGSAFNFWSDESNIRRAMKYVLGHLGCVKVTEVDKALLNLGEPDSKILPLSDSAKRRQNPYPGEPVSKEMI